MEGICALRHESLFLFFKSGRDDCPDEKKRFFKGVFICKKRIAWHITYLNI